MKTGRYTEGGPDSIWRGIIKSRADYSCEICKKRQSPKSLHAHHLASYSDNPNLRIEPTNGVSLCKSCHDAFHNKYGRGGNTKSQFDIFKLEYKPKIKKVILKKPKIKKLKFKKFKIFNTRK